MYNNPILDFNKLFTILSSFKKSISTSNAVKFESLNQGYMNTVIKVVVDSSCYVLSFFNPNRYSTMYSKYLLEEIHDAVKFLKDNGLPVRDACPMHNNETVLVLERDNFLPIDVNTSSDLKLRLVALYNYQGGATIPWEAYTRRHIQSLGESMYRMHKIWSDYKDNKVITDWDTYFEIDSEQMYNYLFKNAIYIKKKLKINIDKDLIGQLIKKVISENKKSSVKSVWQLIHCDFVRSNILFSASKKGEVYPITGILDFEKVLLGPIEVDVARTLAFLYVDCKYKKKVDIEYYFFQGYLGQTDWNYLELLVKYFLWRDLWKLLACNPYENLKDNEHYLRTIANLQLTY